MSSGAYRKRDHSLRDESELAHPQFARPRGRTPEPIEFSISRGWVARHRTAIQTNHDRGMSRTALERIYGRDTVDAVLGPVQAP